jgi:hypothetical protein
MKFIFLSVVVCIVDITSIYFLLLNFQVLLVSAYKRIYLSIIQ